MNVINPVMMMSPWPAPTHSPGPWAQFSVPVSPDPWGSVMPAPLVAGTGTMSPDPVPLPVQALMSGRSVSVMTGSSWWSALLATVCVAVSSHRPTSSGQGTNTAILSTTAVPVTRTSSSPGTRTPPSQSAPRQSVGRREFYGRSVSVSVFRQ